jgi:hypothetical protein
MSNSQNPPIKPPLQNDPPPDPGGNGNGFELQPVGPLTKRTPNVTEEPTDE